MTKYAGKASTFSLTDSGAVERDLSSYVNSVEGLPGEGEVLETTGLGATAKTKLAGLLDAKVSIKGFYDDTATSGPDVVLSGLFSSASRSTTFKYGPKGSTATYPRYTGTAILKDYKLSSAVGGVVTFSADFEVSGAVTRDTF